MRHLDTLPTVRKQDKPNVSLISSSSFYPVWDLSPQDGAAYILGRSFPPQFNFSAILLLDSARLGLHCGSKSSQAYSEF